MRVVVALGGNALLERGQALSAENQLKNVKIATQQIAKIVPDNEVVIAHGNGPQVGLLALQGAAYPDVECYPLDVLGAETEGMIGYLIQQEMGNNLPDDKPVSTLITQVEVSKEDPAFSNPTKPIGPVYSKEEAEKLAAEKGWDIAPDGDKFRRVVPSPRPKRIFEIKPIKWLLDKGSVVVCAGGGGIPTGVDENGKLYGIEAVIDKDLCSALLAEEISADMLIIATDVDGVYLNYGKENQAKITKANPNALLKEGFAAGSMGPKVQAACEFVLNTGKSAMIGALKDIEEMTQGTGGTLITTDVEGIES
ncbi:MAG: carbamate kinase [Gammaproteobacteria bacterium]|nr:carbamate kinase [Gammaproteobacteria bacterium]